MKVWKISAVNRVLKNSGDNESLEHFRGPDESLGNDGSDEKSGKCRG